VGDDVPQSGELVPFNIWITRSYLWRNVLGCFSDPDSNDLKPDCRRACYQCLLSFDNQREALRLNRHAIRDLLMRLANARTLRRVNGRPYHEHLQYLLEQTDPRSDLERRYLRWLAAEGRRLPDAAQYRVSEPALRGGLLLCAAHAGVLRRRAARRASPAPAGRRAAQGAQSKQLHRPSHPLRRADEAGQPDRRMGAFTPERALETEINVTER
jgi:hypothetical protein